VKDDRSRRSSSRSDCGSRTARPAGFRCNRLRAHQVLQAQRIDQQGDVVGDDRRGRPRPAARRTRSRTGSRAAAALDVYAQLERGLPSSAISSRTLAAAALVNCSGWRSDW
jgi:hypothetical protein